MILARPGLALLAAVDLDEGKRGRDLAELLGEAGEAGLAVEGDLAAVLARVEPELAVLCTGSTLEAVRPDLLRLLPAGVNVVSPCEELVQPEAADPEIAAELDRAARRGGATVLGVGVNPGFALDLLPAFLAGPCRTVERVRARRVLDAATRRRSLQRKVGAGLSRDEFDRGLASGELGHVGTRQSVALVGRALGFELVEIRHRVEAVIADRLVHSGLGPVAAGRVAGLRDRGVGLDAAGRPRVELELEMYVGAADPHDEVVLEGCFPSGGRLAARVDGGVPGDAATAALLVNRAPQVVAAAPGLATVLDLPPPGLPTRR
ncbi:MAG: dihydrodipicolinate reductase [Thermoanaerobaculia bacterium]|nr:dihydrodipicolinate reductase [Thermoanaerobaculia bacterium]